MGEGDSVGEGGSLDGNSKDMEEESLDLTCQSTTKFLLTRQTSTASDKQLSWLWFLNHHEKFDEWILSFH